MADIRLAKPAAGTTQTVPSTPNGRFIFDFPADAATLTRNGDDLVLTFEDGSSIQLQGFYTTYSKEEMPSFQVEGVEISGQDFFAALGEDLMPAAGPAASSASRSGRYNEYGGSDLLDGIDHLGRLDIGFDGGTQLATDTVEPSAPEVDIDYDVTIAAGPEAGAVDLTVYEGGLAGGSQAGQAATPTTASGSLNINAPDGVASIVIGDVVVYENGKLTGNVVTTDEGTLAVTGYDPVTGKLDFSYTLDRNTTEHDKSDPATDTQISHDLTVTVTDTDGDSDSTTITVNVVDDVPTIGSFSHEMSEGDAVPVVGNALTGAVAGADGANFAWDANQNGHFGTITLNADGTYSYRLDNDNATVKELTDGETLTEEFTYTYTDADGDIAEGKVTITINGKDNGIVIEPTDPAAGSDTVTVYESGLADGSQAGQDGAPTTASGSLTITAADGVASIVIGGVVVFEKGGLTGNTVSTDEGTLAVTGFDPVTGELKFTYELSGNTTEHSGSGMDDISHDLTVTVTDMDGTEVDSTITVNVVDDVPSIGSFSHEMSEGDAVPVVGNALTGAVAGADGANFAWDANQNGHFGTITLNADGTYSYRLDNDNATVKELTDGETLTEEFTYTYTDADGDIAEGKVTITINGKDNGIVIEPTDPAAGSDTVTVYESGLADGSQAGQDGAPTTASGSLTITAADGVASIVIGGVVVFEKGGLTGNTVSTDEGTLAVTGFDPVTGELKFTYELSGNTTEHSGSGMDDISHDLTVTVTDMDGTEVDSTITVNVVDDVPTISADSLSKDVASGAEVTGRVDIDYGADNEGGQKSLTVNGQKGTAAEDGKLSFDLDNGTLVFDPATGGYVFTADANVTTDQTLDFVVTDADGDADEVTVTVNISKPEAPTFTGTVSVDEEGLADGTNPDATSETATWTAPDGYTIVSVSDGKLGTVVKTGETTLDYTLSDAIGHPAGLGENTATGADSFEVTIMDGNGNTYTVKVDVDVTDDVPTISASDISSTVIPGSGAGNLENGEAADFTLGRGGQTLGHETSLDGWNGVTMYAAKVTYSGSGDNVQISDIDDNGSYTLKYSPYKGSDNDKADWGLTVDAGEHNEEISVIDGNASEAVIFDLGGQLAYGVTIDFGAFYSGDGTAGTTAWDHVSEKALVTFYRDGQIVGSTVVEGNSPDGKFTLNSSDVVLGGFDKVVISAVDNSTTQFPNENSDFTIQGIDFITKRDDPIIINEGKVTAESGADGFADAYADSHVRFDLAGMVNEGSLSDDGNSGDITVLMGGVKTEVTLTLSEGPSGESILTGTMEDGEQLFTATLDENGSWTMEQYEQFRVPGEGEQSSNHFELVFKTQDADGDIVSATVNVPLEVVDLTPGSDASIEIDNGNDYIVIAGGEGVAGTVAAGDSGGMTEGQQVAAKYNVCFVLDTSGSMDEKVGDNPWGWQDTRPTRLDIAVESIENFIDTSIHQGDFVGTVNLAVVPFASTHGETIKVSITRVSDGQGGYTETYRLGNQSYDTYTAFSTEFNKVLGRLDANGGTNYQAGFHKAAEWFGELDNPSGADGNITYFLSDGVPTFHGTEIQGGGNYATLEDVQGAWTGYQELLGVASGMQVNAIGFGTDLDDAAMKTLAMLDNTSSSDGEVYASDGGLYASDGVYVPEGSVVDVLLGMGGDDYLDGGAGEDAIFGGAGNDIIVYDKADYLVSGGSGIDFMVSDDTTLTLSSLLGNSGSDKPLVSGIEVLLKGEDALSLTSLDQLAKEYGITLDTNAEGKETLILDMDKWTEQEDGIYAFNGGAEAGGLTLETNLTPVEASDPASEAVQQQVFTLEHGNG